MTKILIIKLNGMHQLSCEHNKGSAAVASTTIQTLKQFIPDAQFTSFVQFSEAFAKKHGVRVIRNKLFSTKNHSLGTIVKSSLNVTRCALWALLHKRFPRVAKALLSNRELKEYADADVIIDISMDLYCDRRGIASIVEHSKEILMGVFLKRPVVIWAQSPGPFRSKLTSWLVRFTLNRVALIILREEISVDYIRELGVEGPHIYVTADPAFVLEPAPEDRGKEIFSKEGVNGSDRPIIGLTMCWSNIKLKTSTKWYLRYVKSIYQVIRIILPESAIGFVRRQAKQRSSPNISSNTDVEEIAKIVDYLVEESGATVVLVPHDYNPLGDDRVLLGEVLQRAKERDRVRLLAGNYSAPELKAVIGQCDLFIGGKMHANIAATSMFVPTVAIQYSHKFYGIMRLLGQEKYICDKLTVEELESKFDEAWSKRQRIRTELKAKLDIVKEQALCNAKLVADLLNSNRVNSVSS